MRIGLGVRTAARCELARLLKLRLLRCAMPTVQARLDATFRRYGLPQALFVDKGSPRGDPAGQPLPAEPAPDARPDA